MSKNISKKSVPPRSLSKKADLQISIGRINRYIRKGKYADRISREAPIYIAAVLEYIAAEVLEISGNAAHENKKNRITPRHIQLAIRSDEELNDLFHHCTVRQGGVMPNISFALLKKAPPGSDGNGDSQST